MFGSSCCRCRHGRNGFNGSEDLRFQGGKKTIGFQKVASLLNEANYRDAGVKVFWSFSVESTQVHFANGGRMIFVLRSSLDCVVVLQSCHKPKGCSEQVLDDNSTEFENMSSPCDSSGVGQQHRVVRCLSQGGGCDNSKPGNLRECQCVASKLPPPSLGEQVELDASVTVQAGGGALLIGIVAAGCIVCTCLTFGCFTMTFSKSQIKKSKATIDEFDGCGKCSAREEMEEVYNSAPDAVTVCVAAGQRGSREDQDVLEPGNVSTVAESPVPSPSSHASPASYQSRVAPLPSPCSIASVSSQVRLPLPSPSAMSVSSINAVLQSPTHSHWDGGSSPALSDFSPELSSPSHYRLPSPKKKGPSMPILSESQDGDQSGVFAALNSPSNLTRPGSPKKKLAPSLASVAETERTSQFAEPVPAEHPSCEPRHQGSKPRKKAPRPPTLELDRYLEDDTTPMGLAMPDESISFAASPSKSPSKRNASSSFAPPWLREEGVASEGGGTPAHADRPGGPAWMAWSGLKTFWKRFLLECKAKLERLQIELGWFQHFRFTNVT